MGEKTEGQKPLPEGFILYILFNLIVHLWVISHEC